jgi:GMP synthase (glutamine-hydrolysing)
VRVAVVYHCPQTTDRLDDALGAIGAEITRHRLDLGEPLPEEQDRAVVLGGAMGAYDTDEFPWLGEEKAWLASLVESGTPILGICLGAQLLADALGGRAYRAERAEAAVVALELTAAGRAHPVVSEAAAVVYSLHQDTFDLPPAAELLARSGAYPQAFTYASALALQFHPDADLDQALAWGKEDWSLLSKAGVDFDTYAAQLADADEELDRSSRAIFEAWLRW